VTRRSPRKTGKTCGRPFKASRKKGKTKLVAEFEDSDVQLVEQDKESENESQVQCITESQNKRDMEGKMVADYSSNLCLSFFVETIRQTNKDTTATTPTMTPQQKDGDDLSVCVAWSLLALTVLGLIRFSSSLSSNVSECCGVSLSRSKSVTRLSVLILCSRTSRVLTLSRLSFLFGIDEEQPVREEGGRR
jgi:hypothetical protein